jgi:hypothetical protein
MEMNITENRRAIKGCIFYSVGYEIREQNQGDIWRDRYMEERKRRCLRVCMN